MTEPIWLASDVIVAVHEELLARFGGSAGIRDEGLLQSALGRPRQMFAHGSPTVFEMVAGYAHGLVKNHPFMDGNKRVGFMAAYIFLAANGQDLDAPEEEVVLQTLGLAAGDATEVDYAEWLARSCKKAD